MRSVDLNAVVKAGDDLGVEYLVASVSEGFCPVHAMRLRADDPPESNDEDLLLVASAAGRCSECPAWWSAGPSDEGDWASVRDVYLDVDRRLTFNPPQSPED